MLDPRRRPDRRRALHRTVCRWVEEQGLGFLRTEIPYSTHVEQMGFQRNPGFAFAPSSKPARAYEALWSEILERAGRPSARPPLFARRTRERLEVFGRSDPRAG